VSDGNVYRPGRINITSMGLDFKHTRHSFISKGYGWMDGCMRTQVDSFCRGLHDQQGSVVISIPSSSHSHLEVEEH
jgi:hypothetical protein